MKTLTYIVNLGRGDGNWACWVNCCRCNVHDTDSVRTNNHVEGWHSRLKRLGKPYPNIYECVQIFQRTSSNWSCNNSNTIWSTPFTKNKTSNPERSEDYVIVCQHTQIYRFRDILFYFFNTYIHVIIIIKSCCNSRRPWSYRRHL